MNKICVVGLGYIGLPTAAVFAKHGMNVIGVDISRDIVEQINRGMLHIKEPGLESIVREVVSKGKLKAELIPQEADVFIIAVPTPNNKDEYRSCDLSYVLKAVKQVIPFMKKGNVIIVESTIAPRSMEDYIKPLIEAAGFTVGTDIFLVHCPERVLPGNILHELVYNNRVVGGVTPACADAGAKVYELIVRGEIIKTDAKTAEMSKLMENTFRDVNIALANELTKICNELEIDVLDVIAMANKHPRVNIHQPGPGVGGHCLAVDPYFIVAKSPEYSNIIQTSRRTNESMPAYVVDNVVHLLAGIEKPIIAVLGIAYKANVDDIRESPALDIIAMLMKAGFEIRIHDPYVKTHIYRMTSLEEAVDGAHMILLLTDHTEFRLIDFNEIAHRMKKPLLFDTRNCIDIRQHTNIKVVNFGNLHKYINYKEEWFANENIKITV